MMLTDQPPEEWRSTLTDIQGIPERTCDFGYSGCGRPGVSAYIKLGDPEHDYRYKFFVCPACQKLYSVAGSATMMGKQCRDITIIPI
jgi:hypothetical protein